MARQTDLAIRFERAVGHALSNLPGAQIAAHVTDVGDYLLIHETDEGPTSVVVEVKLYTSRFPSRPLLTRAIATLSGAVMFANANGGILATTFDTGELASRVVDIPANIKVLGIDDLLAIARDDAKTYSELLEISRAVKALRSDFDEPVPEASTLQRATSHTFQTFLAFIQQPPSAPTPSSPPQGPPTGKRICDELDAIPSGKDSWKSQITGITQSASKHFEQKCEEAVRYIFEDQLENWDPQSGPDDGSHKYDLFAKIKSGDVAFWETLIRDFRTRYVVFEFKNYSKQIQQNTIYVTEKYLFPTALRSTAIIISPQGSDDGAKAAAKGALRDASKLIISLSRDQICDLLLKRDAGEETQLFMADVLDDILRNIDR